MQKRYFITGGAGFIGSHTVDALIAAGEQVTVFDIKPWAEAENLHHQEGQFAYVEGDIRNLDELKRVLEGHTHVLHLAAIVSVPLSLEDPPGTHATNVTGMLNVLEAARTHDIVRVVFASSAAVYGDTVTLPVKETHERSPLSPYGLHKCINEDYAKLYSDTFAVSVAGLRYFNVFGARQDPSSPYSGVISIFSDRLKRGEALTVFGDGSATRDFVHIDNVVVANRALLDSDQTGVYNVGSGIATSITDLCGSLEAVTGNAAQIDFTAERPGDIKHSLADIRLICDTHDYYLKTDFGEGIKTLF